MELPLQANLITLTEPLAAAAQTALTGEIIDMASAGGSDAITFLAILGTVTDTSVVTLTAYQDDAANMGTEEAIAGGAVTFTASTDSNKIIAVTVVKPEKRYVRCKLTRTTADAEIGGILAIRAPNRAGPASTAGFKSVATTVAYAGGA